jgi:hypothetical protein
MTDHADPPNKNEILQQLRTLSSPEDTVDFVNKHFPGWLILSLTSYSKDYPQFQSNWEKICQMANTTPQKIVLVSDIKFDEEHVATSVIAEFMTRNGYCVRRAAEFIACSECEGAIPCQPLWTLLKDKGMPVPPVWSNRCNDCWPRELPV